MTGDRAAIGPDAADLPPDWVEAAAYLGRKRTRRVMVLGGVDAGKSTLCRALLQAALAEGRRAAIVDADVGQKIIGPPACVTLTRPAADGHLGLSALAFVGTTDPVRGSACVAAALVRLADGSGSSLVLANTDGLLAGPGRWLKAAQIRAFRPDLLLALGVHPALDAVLAGHPDLPVLRLASSSLARRKTHGERRRARQEAFRRYFAGAFVQTVPLDTVMIEHSATSDSSLPPRLLVDLGDEDGHDLALGIVIRSEPPAGTLTLLTAMPCISVRRLCRGIRLRPGNLALDEDFREVRPALSQADGISPQGSPTPG